MRASRNGLRIADETWAFAQVKLAELWSPEQISGYLKANNVATVSHEPLYQRIYADKRPGRHTAPPPALPEGAQEALWRA